MPTLDPAEARRRFTSARVARLATIAGEPQEAGSRRPHVVPLVFAVDADTILSAVDAKPKRTQALRRLANVAAEPHVSLLADFWSEDWDALWWVRADGVATVLAPGEERAVQAVRLLQGKYAQYAEQPPSGPGLAVEVRRWSGWAARPQET